MNAVPDRRPWNELARSPDGELRLEYRTLGAASEMRLTEQDRLHWMKGFPWVPEQGDLADSGTALLAAERRAAPSVLGKRSYLVVALIDASGERLQYQHVLRPGGRMSGRSSRRLYPRVNSLSIDNQSGVAEVRLPERRGPGEWVWRYGRNGELLGDRHDPEVRDVPEAQGEAPTGRTALRRPAEGGR